MLAGMGDERRAPVAMRGSRPRTQNDIATMLNAKPDNAFSMDSFGVLNTG